MKSVRGRIKSYLKYISRMNSFFCSIEFYWMSSGDQIPWRFKIHKNNLCPGPVVLWVITPSVSSVTPNRVALHVTCIYKSRQLYLALPLHQLLCWASEKLQRWTCQMRYILTTQYATCYKTRIPTLNNKLSLGTREDYYTSGEIWTWSWNSFSFLFLFLCVSFDPKIIILIMNSM